MYFSKQEVLEPTIEHIIDIPDAIAGERISSQPATSGPSPAH